MKQYILLLLFFLNTMSSNAQIDLIENAANEGDIEAQMFMGRKYLEGSGSFSKNLTKAKRYFQMAAEQGNLEAMYFLFDLCRKSPNEIEAALLWLEKSADGGYAPAQETLAFFYAHGYKGGNPQKVFYYYNLSAKQEYIQAFDGLGDCYRLGIGVTADLNEARKNYEIAVNNGLDVANIGLALCFAPTDIRLAQKYARNAADKGYIDGFEILVKLLIEQGKYDDANEIMTEALNLFHQGKCISKQTPKTSILSLMSTGGLIYIKVNDLNTANQVWEKIKELDEDFANNSPCEFCETMRSYSMANVDMNIPVCEQNNSNTFALIICNENYQDVANVENALNDGDFFAEYCRKTLGIPNENIHIKKDATLNNMKREVAWLKQVSTAFGGNTKVIFYYAGHGIPDEKSKAAYILPVDGLGTDVSTGYSLNELYSTLSNLSTKQTIVFLDACFSGSQRDNGMLVSARGIAIKPKQEAPLGNMVVLSATQGDETAYSYKEMQHGLFTYFLLKKLQETKGDLTIEDLANYIKENVCKTSIVINGKSQTPVTAVSTSLGDEWKKWTLR